MSRELFGGEALDRLLRAYPDALHILDIGSGPGLHAGLMRAAGREVVTISMLPPADYVGDYLGMPRSVRPLCDAIWASHVLEHQPDPGAFLRCCFADLRDDGVMAVTVPPPKHEIVGGHLSLWNAGLLLYHMVVAGFDCRNARVSGCYAGGPLGDVPYNISVIVRKVSAELPTLTFDSGDIERLAQFFPLPVQQGFDGRLLPINW